MIDLHCHILPGVDDGAPDLDTSVAMAQMALADGIETIVATPHVSGRGYPRPDEIRSATEQLNKVLSDRGRAPEILAGAEVRADLNLAELVAGGDILTLADQGNYLLVEPPFVGVPAYLEQLCFELQIAGITPILAHPERTDLVLQRPEVYRRLVSRGCLMQVNAASIRGDNGERIRKITVSLIRERLAHILSSDAHNCRGRPPLLSDLSEAVAQAGDEHTFIEMTELTPYQILGKQEDDHR